MGWRRRYNAIGTEEWARDDVIAGQPSAAAEAAYARARQAVTESAESTGPRDRGPPSGAGPLMPDAPGLELIAGELRDAHPDSVLGTYHEHGQACLIVDPEQVLAVLALAARHARARSTASSPASTASTTCRPSRASASTTSCSTATGSSASASGRRSPTRAADDLPELDSCVALFPTAEFQEREVYDFFGIVFRGHPDLRRILLPEVYVGWPQRRDFPIGGEPVIFTHNEHEVPGWSRVSRRRDRREATAARPRSRRRRDRRDLGDGDRHLADRAHRGRRRARARARAADREHGPAPPGHPRGAAAAGQPPGRGGARPEAGDRLRPHRDREVAARTRATGR